VRTNVAVSLSTFPARLILPGCSCRARGLELVSPDDLRSAVELFSELGLQVCFREFPSGVTVVQDETWSDDLACERIVKLLSSARDAHLKGASLAEKGLGRGLRPMQLALTESMPVAVAKEQLLLAERVGMLCRDDAAQGLTFYRNFFPEVHF
jgi:ESCRT-II complex subunit VPS36